MEDLDARSSRGWRRLGAGLAVGGAALVVASAALSPVAPDAASALAVAHQTSTGLDWSLYKFTIPVGNGSVWDLFQLVNATLGPVEVSDLGCGGVRASATLLGEKGPQLHWVEAPLLSNDARPVDEWEEVFRAINGDMSAFNGFMHSKATLFTSDLGPTAAALEAYVPSFPIMYRRSTGYHFEKTEHPDWTGALGHVLFPIRGRIYEVVGPMTTDLEGERGEWAEWAPSECPLAHRLDDDLGHYARVWGAYTQGGNETAASLRAWIEEKGFWPPMIVGVSSVADADLLAEIKSGGALAATLENLSGTTFGFASSDDGACEVAYANTVATWTNFKLPVKYVRNAHAFAYAAGSSPGDLTAYVSGTHAAVAGSYENWAGWDHWLDWHVGLKYKEYQTQAACDMVDVLNTGLEAAALPVGQREEADEIHYYVGYDGLLTWEYAVDPFPRCLPTATKNDGADICTCRADNNDVRYLEDTGLDCPGKGGAWGDARR